MSHLAREPGFAHNPGEAGMSTTWIVVIACVIAAALFFRMAALEARLTMLSRVEAKLDALLKHAGIKFDPYGDVPASVVDALRRGDKIQAIRDYRAATGVGLKEAKEFVEEVQRRTRMNG